MFKVGDKVKVKNKPTASNDRYVVHIMEGEKYPFILSTCREHIGMDYAELTWLPYGEHECWGQYTADEICKVEEEVTMYSEEIGTTPKEELDIKAFSSGKYKPRYGPGTPAGLDICNNTTNKKGDYQDFNIYPGEIIELETKLHVQIPPGYVGLVIVRSGLGTRGLTLINGTGVIDDDYRGEIGLKFINHGPRPIEIVEGERVAQMVVVPYIRGVKFVDSLDELNYTERGIKGFGSSGKL